MALFPHHFRRPQLGQDTDPKAPGAGGLRRALEEDWRRALEGDWRRALEEEWRWALEEDWR